MTTIYEHRDKAFARTAAYVILRNNERVATIAFAFPRDGAGRLYAYVHWIGVEMVRGHASGYGYDKKSAAIESAMRALKKKDTLPNDCMVFWSALRRIDGNTWDRALQDAGFTVMQAV